MIRLYGKVFVTGVLEISSLVLLFVWILSIRPRVRETTLTHVWSWAAAATGILLLVAMTERTAARSENAAEAWRFAAWSLTLCPALSLLGCKRPQHVAWNFVVFSLWGILILPVVETVWLRAGRPIDLGELRRWFLLGLILLGPASFFATRYATAALLLAMGQTVFFARDRPFADWLALGTASQRWAGAGLGAAACIAEFQFRRLRTPNLHPLDRLWLDFRDAFGLFWSLRVAERINAALQVADLPLRLEWEGFVTTGAEPPDLQTALNRALSGTLRTTIRGLLRRFATNAWIEDRLQAGETAGANGE